MWSPRTRSRVCCTAPASILRATAAPDSVLGDALLLRDGQLLTADAVIALPRLRGRPLGGMPADDDGFIATDEHARVMGVPHVYAAGDVTVGAIKQGGLAAQQADAAAEAIAAEAGVDLDPRPYRPVLRGLLLTGDAPLYMRKDLTATTCWRGPCGTRPPGPRGRRCGGPRRRSSGATSPAISPAGARRRRGGSTEAEPRISRNEIHAGLRTDGRRESGPMQVCPIPPQPKENRIMRNLFVTAASPPASS